MEDENAAGQNRTRCEYDNDDDADEETAKALFLSQFEERTLAPSAHPPITMHTGQPCSSSSSSSSSGRASPTSAPAASAQGPIPHVLQAPGAAMLPSLPSTSSSPSDPAGACASGELDDAHIRELLDAVLASQQAANKGRSGEAFLDDIVPPDAYM